MPSNEGGNEIMPWNEYKDNIMEIRIEYGIKNIENNSFQNFGKLKNVVISETVRKIGSYSFSKCEILESIEIKSCTLRIEKNAFENCNNLKKVVVAEGATSFNGST